MPVTLPQALPAGPVAKNYLDTQYVKFFDYHSLDFDLIRRAGQWKVVVWEREDLPTRVSTSIVHLPSVTVVKLLVSGEPRETLEDALLYAYNAVKNKLY